MMSGRLTFFQLVSINLLLKGSNTSRDFLTCELLGKVVNAFQLLTFIAKVPS